jgi:hypothetical protein
MERLEGNFQTDQVAMNAQLGALRSLVQVGVAPWGWGGRGGGGMAVWRLGGGGQRGGEVVLRPWPCRAFSR